MILVAGIGELESISQIQRLAIQRADRKLVWDRVEDRQMLFAASFETFRLHKSAGQPFCIERHPAIGAGVFVFFEHEVARFAAVKISHAGITFPQLLEKVHHRFALLRQLSFCCQVQIDVVLFAHVLKLAH